MRVITLARKPLIGSVADNVLRHDTGGLNIDGCRIGYETGGSIASNPLKRITSGHTVRQGMGTSRTSFDVRKEEREFDASALGRWPANVILEHRPECQCVGTRKVKVQFRGDNEVGEGGQFGTDIYGDSKGRRKATPRGYADEDGLEEVPAWECHPDCPVAVLDDQSGELTSGGKRGGDSKGENSVGGPFGPGWNHGITHGDSGTASRFYRQVQVKDEPCE